MLFVLIRGLWTLCEESHIVTNNFNFNSRLFDKYCTGKKSRKVRRIRNTTSISATDKLRNRTRTALIALHQTTLTRVYSARRPRQVLGLLNDLHTYGGDYDENMWMCVVLCLFAIKICVYGILTSLPFHTLQKFT